MCPKYRGLKGGGQDIMNGLSLVIAAATVGLAATVNSASADNVFIGYSVNGGATITQIASGTGSASINMALGSFTVDFLSGAVGVFPDLLLSNSLNIAGSIPGTLDIYVTETNVPLAAGTYNFLSDFTTNVTGMTVTESTYFDNADGKFTTSNLLGTELFNPPGLGVGSSSNSGSVGGAFSVTERFSLSGSGTDNSTIDFAVPGPILGAGLPGAIVACGALLALARRRRNSITSV
jgi:hypothetical protein